MRPNNNALRLFWTAAIAVIFVSCSKDPAEVPEKMNNIPENASGLYSFTIAAGKAGATRAVLDQSDYKYYWETGDQTALIIVPAGSGTPIDPANPVITMTNDHVETTEHTTFSGELTQTQLIAVSSQNSFDYYSYFPYGAGTVETFPNVQFTIPSTLSLESNVFNSNYAPMVAEVETNRPPVVYLNGQELVHGDMIHFNYKHVMSYAAIELDVRLQQQKVTSVTITNNDGTKISGTYNYNMDSNSGGYISGSNSINIIGEFNVGDGSVLYVPMPPVDMTGENFTLTFQTGSSNNKYEDTMTVPGTNFERGKIHRLRVAPAATYNESTTFTVTKDGYYYIEAWGGNGGSGQGGASGGTSQKVSGLFQFTAGETINVYVGRAGTNATGTGTGGAQPAGGTNGSSYGNGGAGGPGGDASGGGNHGGKGGGGGAGTFILRNGGNLLVAGGGGGGGGKYNGSASSSSPGNGGDSNYNGSTGSGDPAGRGGAYTGAGGKKGSAGILASAATDGGNGSTGVGGAGGRGDNSSLGYSAGGGGGGGGGGYYQPSGVSGGGGGGGDVSTADGNGGGGGGAGGANYVGATTTNPGKSLPNTARPSGTDGYVVITFLR